MAMDPNTQKEQFSNAYLHSVVSAAGFHMAKPAVDDNSVDWTISGYKDGVLRYKPVLDVQIKCTGDDEYLRTDTIAFDLEQKNYNDLCDVELMYPRILIVVVVPRHVNRWVVHTEGQMSLHYCGYWKSIKGEAPTNQTTKEYT